MNAAINFFNWYRRYKVTAQDMTDFQTAMVDSPRGVFEGAFSGAVLEGLEASAGSGLAILVEPGIAVAPTGNVMAATVQESVAVTVPVSNVARGLVVMRPKLVDNEYITKPTSPFESVPLKTQQSYELVFIPGTASATPEYPAKEANDVIVCGVKLASGQSQVVAADLDFTVRDHALKNGPLGKNAFRFDPRLRPSRTTYRTMTIEPGQYDGSDGKVFLYAGRGVPTKFPKDGSGDFNFANTILNFETGEITGGDEASDDFMPTIPSAANSIVATVCLRADDTLQVLYGTEGTYAQCLAAIENQTSSGAGSIQTATGSYKIAYVIISSIGGSISDIQVVDCRPLGGGGGAAGGGVFLDLFSPDDGTGAIECRAPVSAQKALRFDVAAMNRALGTIKVPQGYSQGSQIRLRMTGETAATGGSMAIRVKTNLIRRGTDACGSTANQNSATGTFTGQTPANALLETSVDLTSLTGTVNGVTVSPGDELELALDEVGSSDLGAELYLRKAAVEVTFG